jgi:hypothetical protein
MKPEEQCLHGTACCGRPAVRNRAFAHRFAAPVASHRARSLPAKLPHPATARPAGTIRAFRHPPYL